MKFEAEGQEFAKVLRSLEQFIFFKNDYLDNLLNYFFVTENTRGRLIKRTIKRSQSVMGMLTCTGGYSKQVENYRAKNIQQVYFETHYII